ncbi:hypothetical protein [Williamwhitmania taraxaci]|uniref:hypothetical protein n=1 Tax=Williamwhitmania taraxaci TaxID=1640674 RepID=UPI0014815602|nr:hypothetical protein [Williamwhitmania taraxaci]
MSGRRYASCSNEGAVKAAREVMERKGMGMRAASWVATVTPGNQPESWFTRV